MRKSIITVAFLAAAAGFFAFMPEKTATTTSSIAIDAPAEGGIRWMSWDEAVKANAKVPKKLFIDFYTDWCGWCKRMDATTFQDPKVAAYMNKHFYAVKFDAEQREDVEFMGTTFKWREGGRNGVHMLAYELLNGRLGYPSYVYLTPQYERILISPGYKQVDALQQEMLFVAEDHYNATTWEEFQRGK